MTYDIWTMTYGPGPCVINPGHNDRIVKACKTLNDYQSFVAKVREFMYDGLGRDEAAAKSIDYCIKNDILRDFLSKHRAEVKKMILSVYDEEKVMNLLKEQYREEYLEEGLEKGREEGVSKANDLFASVINYVKEGKSKEELLKMGFPETTVDLVLSARS